MLQAKVNPTSGTFESGDISKAICKLFVTIGEKEIKAEFTEKVEAQKTIACAIKAFFSDGNSDTFLSAVLWAQDNLLSKTVEKPGKKEGEIVSVRVPLEPAELETLSFSYTQAKKTGEDISPVVFWKDIVAKFQACQPFTMVQVAPRKPRKSDGKVIEFAY